MGTIADDDDQKKLNETQKMDVEESAEAAAALKKELRRKKRKKMAILFVIFTIFQIGMLLVTVLVVMKNRTPQFKLKSATFEAFNVNPAATNPSFNLTMIPNIRIKNTNFGTYKYGETTVTFFYRGSVIGSAVVYKSKVGMRSTKKIRGTAIELSSTGINGNLVAELGNDLSSGMLPVTSQARLNGKVEMMFIIKRKKSANMNCSMKINISTRELQEISCN
ncbi:late embryogenesis abundant protein At1g64065-like [Impatiens glandulifera]|uniref:late embryogenesis abundant protein At1g64065-like n=1 Tax=Impatiens glandulifera TaxID=253017 RepID=UPI001FB08582|nr:late embryogenesis abundant protein At1g64065-like [Impatiens glandulifera]